jgi:hypothetical protein
MLQPALPTAVELDNPALDDDLELLEALSAAESRC